MPSPIPPLKNYELEKTLSSTFVKTHASVTVWGKALNIGKMLPSLRGLWSFSSVDESNYVYDYSEQGRALAVGAAYPTMTYHGLIPYSNYTRASSQYMQRASEPGIRITGGLTVMSWVWFDTESTGNKTGIISKWYETGLPAPMSFELYKDTNNYFNFAVSTDGSTSKSVNNSTNSTYAISRWFFLAGVFDPSTAVKIFVNGTWFSNTTSIPATIYDGTEPLCFGRTNRSNYLDGRISLSALCAIDLSSELVSAFYEHTKAMYGIR